MPRRSLLAALAVLFVMTSPAFAGSRSAPPSESVYVYVSGLG